jgi:ParB family chromosome partitioning protein
MPPRKKKPSAGSTGLAVKDMTEGVQPPAFKALAEKVDGDGGQVLASYKDPLGGAWVLLAALPIDKVEPTPYQRELSETHAERLAGVMQKVGRFLDPIIATAHDAGYWTPNGMHRLTAMKRLGAKSIVALVLAEPEIAFRILALNTEKAHNLKDKSLEVVRMAHAIATDSETADRAERDWAFEFEEPAYLTIGQCYEKNGRFAGGAYMPIVKRTDDFSAEPIRETMEIRAEKAAKLLDLDAKVGEVVSRLKAAGFQSAYLKPFVIARLNPLRFVRAAKPGQKAPRADFDATIDKMIEKADSFDVGKVKAQDLAQAAAYGGSADDAS